MKNHYKIVENIFIITSSSKFAMEIRFKCLKNLAVMNVLPPPGGPIAPTK